MPLLANDPLTQIAFSLFEGKGVFALLLGSGLSRAAEIPTGWEITLDLIRRIAAAQGTETSSDWAAWYREKTGQEPNYSALLEEIASSPEERRSILHNYIEPSVEDRNNGRKIPTAAHRAIAYLVQVGYIRVIVTTNFDRLLENALREMGIEPTVIASPDALAGAEPMSHSACYILKLHGDYKDARILNTDRELDDYPPQYNQLLDRILDEHGLIVAGWSGEWDRALRSAILRAPNRRYTVFWTSRGNIGNWTQELVDQRRARVVPITDADTFFSSIKFRVETLEQSRQQNPLSKEILVNSAKRFLSKPEFRIQLDDLFSNAVDRLFLDLDDKEFAADVPYVPSSVKSRVRRYEGLSETLVGMVGVLGRWGEGKEFAIVQEILRGLYTHAENVGSGLNLHLGLRSYPAVLIFTAYGLGLTRAERWTVLNRLFKLEIFREDREPRRAVDALFLNAWKGGQNNWWNEIEGHNPPHHTPLSDHLFELFKALGKDFLGPNSGYELLFDRFEILGSLAYLGNQDKAAVIDSLKEPASYGTRMPIGRSAWRSSSAEKIFGQIASEPLQSALINDAGFAQGDTHFFATFVRNFKRLAGRLW